MVINGRKIVALCFRSPLQCLISLLQPPSETLQLPNLFVILSQQIFQLLPNSATCPCHHDKERQSSLTLWNVKEKNDRLTKHIVHICSSGRWYVGKFSRGFWPPVDVLETKEIHTYKPSPEEI